MTPITFRLKFLSLSSILIMLSVVFSLSIFPQAVQTRSEQPVSPEMPTSTPRFDPQYVLLSETELVEIAVSVAGRHGLETIESQETAWFRQGDWLGELGTAESVRDSDAPVFVVSFHGSGQWKGLGGYPKMPDLTGMTVTLNGTSGTIIATASGYRPLVLESGRAFGPIPPEETAETD